MVHIFLLNNHAGQSKRLNNIRTQLKEIKEEIGPSFKYYVFNVRTPGGEGEEVKKIIRYFYGTERIRLYACGGSGTLRNAVNGLPDIDDAEVAFYPCGLTNDFLKVFGEKAKDFFDLRKLINGKPKKTDYIETNAGRLINAVSLGFDSKIIRKMEDYRAFSIISPALPYLMGGVNGVFFSAYQNYRVILDNEKEIVGNMAEVFFGNGAVLGGRAIMTKDADPFDGLFNVTFIMDRQYLKITPAAIAAMKGDYEALKKYSFTGSAKEIVLERTDKRPFEINFDGELQEPRTRWEAKVIKEGLNFVIPKGVSV